MWKLLEMGQRAKRRNLHQEMEQHHLSWELPHPAGAGFVGRYRGKLITSELRLDTILDALQHQRILTSANLDAVNIYAAQGDKRRVLMDLLLQKGDKAQEAFHKALVRSDPLVAAELDHQSQEQVCRADTHRGHPSTF